MNKVQMTGVVLAMSAAAMFSSAPSCAAENLADIAKMVNCKGQNACKGQSACKTADNACVGKNACKGKGSAEMTMQECKQAGGTYDKKYDE